MNYVYRKNIFKFKIVNSTNHIQYIKQKRIQNKTLIFIQKYIMTYKNKMNDLLTFQLKFYQ